MSKTKIILEVINKYDVVSFDIFDTLIKRDCSCPSRVFNMIEKSLGDDYLSFAEKRIEAEKKCRENIGDEEITLHDIYEEMREICEWNCDFLKNEEIKFEEALCHANPQLYAIFKRVIEQRKYVVLISDMYLPKTVIENILEKNGLSGYSRLYLSSEIKRTKRTGGLYEQALSDLMNDGIIRNSSQIIHIGDNRIADYYIPLLKSIRSILIGEDDNNVLFGDLKYSLSQELSYQYRDMMAFISSRETENNTLIERVGYECLGPVLYGFSNWVFEQIQKQGIDKVFFLSRDGQIMKTSWERFGHEGVESFYLYGSRRAYIVPTLHMYKSLEEMMELLFLPRIGTIEAFLCKLGIDSEKYIDKIEERGLYRSVLYNYSDLLSSKEFKDLFESLKQDIINNSRDEYSRVVEYLKKMEFKGRVALVDIGWHANMQKALVKICNSANIDVQITGLYLGVNPHTKGIQSENEVGRGVIAKGYLFERNKNENLFNYQKNFTSLLEVFFSADHGSVYRFDELLKPCMLPFEYSDTKESKESIDIIRLTQKKALQFVEHIINEPEFIIDWDPLVVFHNILVLGNYPTKKMANCFGDLIAFDDKEYYIAKPESIIIYIKNIWQLKSDYHSCGWKIGFFKRLLGINVPYYYLRVLYYKLVRR